MPPLFRKRRVLAFKTETTPGTLVSLASGDAALAVFNPTASPGGEFRQRPRPGSFSQLAGTVGPKTGTVKFSTDLYGGATIPFWAATLLPACGWVDTSDVFSPETNPPGTGGVKTISIGGYFDGVKKALRGAVGNADFVFVAGEAVRIDWTFMGIWVAPTDVAVLSATMPTATPLSFVSAALSLASYAHKVGNATLSLGNTLAMREDANDPSGYAHAIFTGRTPTFKFDPEATLIATDDPYGDWAAYVEGALSIALGSAGNGVAFAAPKAQISQIDETDRGGIDANDITLQLNSNAANDNELTITII